MMAGLPPLYRDARQTYHSDNCVPLVDAAHRGRLQFMALARGQYPGRPLPDEALPGLRSLGYWDATGPQDWGLALHRNEGIELTFLESGTLEFEVEDHPYDLKPGALTIVRPWQAHRVGAPHIGPSRLHWFILDVDVRRPNQAWQWPPWLVLSRADLDKLECLLRHNENPVWPAGAELQACWQRIGRALTPAEGMLPLSRVAVLLNELMLLVLEMLEHHQVRLDPRLASTRRMVELFLTDLRGNGAALADPWTLESLAAHCGLGVTRFVHHCRQLTNMTPMQWLNLCRVEVAAGLLRGHPEKSITTIAYECGFGSSQYFATVFRRVKRCSPRAFRAGQGHPQMAPMNAEH